ncbi:efflux RND transporter permease subunit [Thermomonas sp.]|jgi:HAE1 family hydrophobic/amphiphilic exporter-1|uniref:efflux RND transporter permease subunit n=1 Tax=Thermomonas sp. TaxID=1971895 RepID=UPI001B5A2127|nr:efflux RND transporter permease subunit [Thermomonas sp.]MBK6924734.1 efflux RND transporter permease subunit [Thermomonas sp.]MBL0227613.1 efflux RND transporter permease subunit [Thermomonas sp.]MBP6438525.1 efflux RND transporter permease subunit [Thermomonas sp.]MBP7788570.1 efflux RND transporter permease subunit [Thermomonas sp.]MBP8615171.1 efflux RND transporter permease subunit [Thermomonas sp.]
MNPAQPGPGGAHDPLAAPAGFSLVEFATRRRVTVAMMTLTLVLFGLIALGSLKVNLLPDLSYPTLTVRTDYTGAAPAEIETLISQPAEEALGVVKGLRKLKSVSRTGQSDVVLEFAWGTDMDQASLDVRDKMEALQFPLEAEPPVLLRFNPSTQPIMRLALSPKDTDTGAVEEIRRLMELRRFADDDLKRKLEPVDGVAAVKVGGGLEDEVQVDIDQRKLAQLGLSLESVVQRLQQENINVSGGRLEEGTQRYLVRTVNQFATVEEIGNMLLTTRAAAAGSGASDQAMRVAAASGDASVMAALSQQGGGNNAVAGGMALRLKDVAVVRQGYKEREAIIRLDGREAVELAIYKEGDANTVSTADALEAKLAAIRAQLPRDIELTVIEDQSQFIRHAISDVKLDAVIGGVLSILIIFLFLRDGWSTFVISLSLPVSIVATFFFMGQLGLSLNVMSLGGLALATGLVVDDSIVVLESIAKARERGLGILEAAITGTREVSMAVVASTLTTIAVFLPLVFVQGIAGQLFRDQALTVAIAIAVSLVVAMTLIPMLSALKGRPPMGFPEEPGHPRWVPGKAWQKPAMYAGRGLGGLFRHGFFAVAWAITRLWRGIAALVGPVMRKASDLAMAPYARAERTYLRILPNALARPTPVLLVASLAFLLTMAAVPLLGTDLIPQLAQDRFEMTAKLPPGTPLAQTDALIREVQGKHAKDDGVRVLYGVSGTGTRLDASPTESGENIGKLSVVMADNDAEARLTDALRATMQANPSAQVDFSRPELFSLSPPLEIEVEGNDLESIRAAGAKLAGMLRGNPHYADVKSTVEQGFPEIQIRFDQERAAALGLTTRQIADVVVNKVRGNVATRYSFRDRKIDVLVRVQESDRASVEDIRRLIVNPGRGAPVELASVAEVVSTTGPSEIHRVDQRRVAIVSANLRDVDLGTAISEVESMVGANPLGADIDMRIGGQGQELDESIRSLLFAFALAIFLVYLVMASQFESLLHPFVILFTIPLALVGAVAALLLTRSPASVVVFIGLILLVGLVVKNAIILIDKVNQLREAGVAKRAALVEGARSRLRPIIMTTMTALFGFMPLALAFGEGSEVRSPMAITVIGGLLVSTLLTLVVIPIVYDLLDRKPDEAYAERGRSARRDAQAVAEVLSHEHDPLGHGGADDGAKA